MLDLEKFRKDMENFSGEMNLEYYLNWSGQKDELGLSGIYDKYSNLFEKENETRIRELRARQRRGGEEERRLRYLQTFVTEELLARSVKEYTDRYYSAAAIEKIKVDGKEFPYRLAEVMFLNEDDRRKRKKIFNARNNTIEQKFTPILHERLERLHEMAKELGYANYLDLFQDAKGIDFRELDETMTYFVQRTESLFVDKMSEKTKQVLRLELNEAEKHDIGYIFRAKEFDSYFKKDRVPQVLEKTLKGIGFDLSQHRNVLVDLEERPKKNPRAFTALVKIPDDVRLVVMPIGGQDDYAAMLHEAGHAVHHASVDPSLPTEYKWLGDTSVTETYAFLFEYLTLNSTWLNDNVGVKNLEGFFDFAYTYKLYFLRRYAAKVKYEILLHSSKDTRSMGTYYEKILEASLRFKHPKVHYLIDLDDGFYSAQYLRAWIFEAQLRSKMIEKYGKTWFKDPEAGKFLAELWSNGQKYNVTELAQRIGFKGLDINPILAEIREHFEQPK